LSVKWAVLRTNVGLGNVGLNSELKWDEIVGAARREDSPSGMLLPGPTARSIRRPFLSDVVCPRKWLFGGETGMRDVVCPRKWLHGGETRMCVLRPKSWTR
jgi:hypothetical protein